MTFAPRFKGHHAYSQSMKLSNIHKISELVLYYCHTKDINVTHLKLQKLLYYIQSWHLVFFDKNPLWEQAPEAWVNGPVYRTIYSAYHPSQGYTKFARITPVESDIEAVNEKYQELYNELDLSDDQKDLIITVLDGYATMTSGKLVILTHSEKPWNEARANCTPAGNCKEEISLDLMFDYYSARVKK